MRHRLSGRHLGRTSAHRAALYRNLANALVTHECIRTTLPGGYTRILKCGFRPGDQAPMAYIMLVERTAKAEVAEGEAAAE